MSPVNIITSIPIFFNSSITAFELSLTLSAIAIIPKYVSLAAIYITVFPWSKSSSPSFICSSILIEYLSIIFLFPTITSTSPTGVSSKVPVTPSPVIELKLLTLNISNFLKLTSLITASANGCSEFCSKLPTTFKSTFSSNLLDNILVTVGLPTVIVPVLSNTTVSTLHVFSKASPDFIKIPNSAPLPVPTIIAVGVAKPNEQGQAITKTDINIVNANTLGVAFKTTNPKLPTIYQIKLDTIAIPITIGTK